MIHPREKRKLERFHLEVPAKVEVMETDQEVGLHDLVTSDISSGGAFFHTTTPLPIGTEVKIGLALPLDKFKAFVRDYKEVYVVVTGRVLRSGSAGMAVVFNQDYRFRPLRVGTAPKH